MEIKIYAVKLQRKKDLFLVIISNYVSLNCFAAQCSQSVTISMFMLWELYALFILERLGNPQAAVWNTGKYRNLVSAGNATQWSVDASMGVLPGMSLVYPSMICNAVNFRVTAVAARGRVSEIRRNLFNICCQNHGFI
jgi:hypothetical protein